MKKMERSQKLREEGNQETKYGRKKQKRNKETGNDGREDGMIG